MTSIGKAVEVDQPFNDRLSDNVLNQIRPDKTRPAGDQQVHKVFGMYRASMTVSVCWLFVLWFPMGQRIFERLGDWPQWNAGSQKF